MLRLVYGHLYAKLEMSLTFDLTQLLLRGRHMNIYTICAFGLSIFLLFAMTFLYGEVKWLVGGGWVEEQQEMINRGWVEEQLEMINTGWVEGK